jgi:pilus assembly protein Flp/PilA
MVPASQASTQKPKWRCDEFQNPGGITMNNLILKLYVKLQELKNNEEGQDLVEYALVVALIAFGAVTGLQSLSSGINSSFLQISTTLSSAL